MFSSKNTNHSYIQCASSTATMIKFDLKCGSPNSPLQGRLTAVSGDMNTKNNHVLHLEITTLMSNSYVKLLLSKRIPY